MDYYSHRAGNPYQHVLAGTSACVRVHLFARVRCSELGHHKFTDVRLCLCKAAVILCDLTWPRVN